jgi:SAM-dependent methyltransferase
MFEQLQIINQRPEPFSVYTAAELWTDPHTSQEMLKYHLNKELALASRTSDTIDRSVVWLQSRFNIDNNTRIADFGCGPGLYTSRLAQLGAQITGIDFSANSIDYARTTAERQKLHIDYRQENYLDFNNDQQYDLICMIMCDFCALSPQQRKQLLGIFHRHLKSDGALFLDVYSLASYEQRQECADYEFRQLNGFWSAEDYYGFINTFKYADEKIVLDKYSLFEADRSRVIYNWLQYYSLEVLANEFVENGFSIRETYADTAGAPYREGSAEIAVVAKRRD